MSRISVALLVVFVSFLLPPVSQASVTITTAASVGPPPISGSYEGYIGNVLSNLSTGGVPVTFPSPSPYYYTLAPTNLLWGAVCVDNSGQRVWLGQVISDPASPFFNERGTAFYVNAVFVGDGVHKFSADSVTYQVTSSDSAHSLNGSGTLAGLTYGVDPIIGVCYGPDGLLHTADDIVYGWGNPAPASTPVDWIIYSGVAVGYDATSVGLGAVQSYVDSVGSFNLTTAYTVNDGTGLSMSSQTRIVGVPEPTTLVLILSGISGVVLRRCRQPKKLSN